MGIINFLSKTSSQTLCLSSPQVGGAFERWGYSVLGWGRGGGS